MGVTTVILTFLPIFIVIAFIAADQRRRKQGGKP